MGINDNRRELITMFRRLNRPWKNLKKKGRLRILKITVKAMLIDISEEQKQSIDDLMTVFCAAIRFSFKRILEGIKIGDLEKLIAGKYCLNIRQAKDAVENARQTIASQKELVKMNYDNTTKKETELLKFKCHCISRKKYQRKQDV